MNHYKYLMVVVEEKEWGSIRGTKAHLLYLWEFQICILSHMTHSDSSLTWTLLEPSLLGPSGTPQLQLLSDDSSFPHIDIAHNQRKE